MGYLSTNMMTPLYSFTLQSVQITGQSGSNTTPETVINEVNAQNPLGSLIKWNDNVYRYVQFDAGTTAGTAGAKVDWETLTIGQTLPVTTTDVWLVTAHNANAIGTLNCAAGVLKGVVTNNQYTWIGVGGVHLCQVAAGAVAGNILVGGATDSVFNIATGSSLAGSTVYGTALETRGATVASQCKSLLANMIW